MSPGITSLLAWSAWTLAALAVLEYLTHKYLMHRTPRRFRRLLRPYFHEHAVLHHRDGRTDLNITLPWRNLLAAFAPVLAAQATLGDWPALATVLAVTLAYARTWSGLHAAFHGVGGGWTRRLPGYRALRAHHLAHHEHPGRNFGTVFGPLMDRACGTHLPV